MVVDGHVHLLPDRLAVAIRRFFTQHPAVDAALVVLRETRSTYADLTPIGLALAPVSRAQIAGLEHRLLLGSDAPNTGVSIEQAVGHVRALGLDPAGEAAVLGGTAERLLAR